MQGHLRSECKNTEFREAFVVRLESDNWDLLGFLSRDLHACDVQDACIIRRDSANNRGGVSSLSAAPCVGTEKQRVQRQAYDVAPFPQPSAAERPAHAAERHLPGILPSSQHNAPRFPALAGEQLPELSGQRQQHNLSAFAIQLRSRQPVPDARWVSTMGLILFFYRRSSQSYTSVFLFNIPPSGKQRPPLLPTCPQRSR